MYANGDPALVGIWTDTPPGTDANLPMPMWVSHFGQIKEQHAELKKRLDQLGRTMPRTWGEYAARSDLRKNIYESAVRFMSDLDRHIEWAETHLFPVAEHYTGGRMGPVNVLKQHVVLAKRFYREYLEKERDGAEEAITCLLQALTIVSDILRLEEEAVFPVMEKMKPDERQD